MGPPHQKYDTDMKNMDDYFRWTKITILDFQVG